MTALKPIEYREVRGVAARRYPINNSCSHPECAEPRNGRKGAHHIFPRSMITNDSWFVVLDYERDYPYTEASEANGGGYKNAIPHVTWLCPDHHDDVEQHRAWIKLEDGEFVWYWRSEGPADDVSDTWHPLGPLDPQPGGRVKARKPKKRLKGEARRKRKTLSFKVPDDLEDGAGLIMDNLEQLEEDLGYEPKRTLGWTLMDATSLALIAARDEREGVS